MRSFHLRNAMSAKLRHLPGGTVLLLLGLSITGCSIPTKPNLPELEPEPAAAPLADSPAKAQCEFELQKLMTEKDVQHQEIERLQKVVAEKDAQIRSQQARQQDQAKTLQETSNLAAQAQVKLRRLATRPAAASAIAEVEMVMGNLTSSPLAGSEQMLQTQAQRLLSAAVASYAERVRSQVEALQPMVKGRQIALTVSIGIVESQLEDMSATAVFARADHALYEAKRAGRNRAYCPVLAKLEA